VTVPLPPCAGTLPLPVALTLHRVSALGDVLVVTDEPPHAELIRVQMTIEMAEAGTRRRADIGMRNGWSSTPAALAAVSISLPYRTGRGARRKSADSLRHLREAATPSAPSVKEEW
jgi:hypothetical protein